MQFECVNKTVGQVKLSLANAGTGNATTTVNDKVPTGRGNGYAVDFTVGNNTIADIDGVLITVSIDGQEVFTNVPALDYSSLFNNRNTKESVPFQGGSTITFAVVNDQANAVPVFLNLYFVPLGS